jgi:hypothetical protein
VNINRYTSDNTTPINILQVPVISGSTCTTRSKEVTPASNSSGPSPSQGNLSCINPSHEPWFTHGSTATLTHPQHRSTNTRAPARTATRIYPMISTFVARYPGTTRPISLCCSITLATGKTTSCQPDFASSQQTPLAAADTPRSSSTITLQYTTTLFMNQQ